MKRGTYFLRLLFGFGMISIIFNFQEGTSQIIEMGFYMLKGAIGLLILPLKDFPKRKVAQAVNSEVEEEQ